MKGLLYLASVIRAYRQAIDAYWQTPEDYRPYSKWQEDLASVSHRPYTRGFLFPRSSSADQVASSTCYVQSHTLAGIVRPCPSECLDIDGSSRHSEESWIVVEVRSRLQLGTTIEFLYPDGSTRSFLLTAFQDLKGMHLTVANPNAWIRFTVDFVTFPLQIIRTLVDLAKTPV